MWWRSITPPRCSPTRARRRKRRGSPMSNLFLGNTAQLAQHRVLADCIIINMVLHHTPSPATIFKDLSRTLTPGGALIVTDLCRHEQDWARVNCGDLWQGFEPADFTDWATEAGLNEGQSLYIALRNGFQVQLRQFFKPNL